MRPIDADRLLKMMSHWKPYMDMDNVREAIKKMPTVDAVPVVQCRECKYGKCGVDNMVRCSHPCGKVISITAEDFCSYGACMDIVGEESIC